jgi:hypothetical protein
MNIPEVVIKDWLKNKKRIQDRLNRINKRLKKYTKQKNHFEMRMREILRYEKETGKNEKGK